MTKSEAGKLGALKAKDTLIKQMADRVLQYNQNPKRCLHCKKPIEYRNRNNKFCNHSCSAIYHNTINDMRHYPKQMRK